MKTFQKSMVGRRASLLPMFVTSAAIVWILIIIQGSDLLLRTTVLEKSTLELIKYQTQDCRLLFFYVLRERWYIIPMLFLFSTTQLAPVAGYGVLLWYGASTGAVLGIAMLRYGISGILLMLAGGLPQYLLYVPAVVAALQLSMQQRSVTKKFLIQLFLLEVVVIIGCILESYVNLILVEKIIKIFITG